jgi:hypothetical protein
MLNELLENRLRYLLIEGEITDMKVLADDLDFIIRTELNVEDKEIISWLEKSCVNEHGQWPSSQLIRNLRQKYVVIRI